MGKRVIRWTAVATAACASALVPGLVAAATAATAPGSEAELQAALGALMAKAPAASGAQVVDLSDGHVVFADREDTRRLSASIAKLYTISTALIDLGQATRVPTGLLGTGRRVGSTWQGDLYLRGGGDFTFGTASFARRAYGSAASAEALAAALRRRGVRRVSGSVYGDATLFTDNGGTPFGLVLCRRPLFGTGCPYGVAGRFERPMPNGPRTPIGFDRGLRSSTGADPQARPAVFAAQGLVRALAGAGIRVDGAAGARRTPASARALAETRSPTVARLSLLITRPSDNYAADSMLRLLGVRAGGAGSGPAGARVVSRTIAREFGIRPEVESGSGESIEDRTSPREVVRLLTAMRTRPEGAAFARSLSVAGRSGTLLRLKGTPAAGRCQLKDGTRVDEVQRNTTLNLVGYCRSASGRTFAFAVLMNGMPIRFVPPDRLVSPAYALEDGFVQALATYRG